MAVLLQPGLVLQHAARPDLPAWIGLLKGVWEALATGFVYRSGDPALDTLLSRGGMDSMLNTIWLIMAALAFGAVLEHAGMLERIVAPAVAFARATVALVATVVATAIGMNVLAGDQYLSVVLPGRMFKAEFARRGLAPRLLSRTLGDSGTVTAPLVPWNSCGAYMSATLGVFAFAYLPFAFFNLLNPLTTILAAFLIGRTMAAAPAPAAQPETRRRSSWRRSRSGCTPSPRARRFPSSTTTCVAATACSACVSRISALASGARRAADPSSCRLGATSGTVHGAWRGSPTATSPKSRKARTISRRARGDRAAPHISVPDFRRAADGRVRCGSKGEAEGGAPHHGPRCQAGGISEGSSVEDVLDGKLGDPIAIARGTLRFPDGVCRNRSAYFRQTRGTSERCSRDPISTRGIVAWLTSSSRRRAGSRVSIASCIGSSPSRTSGRTG